MRLVSGTCISIIRRFFGCLWKVCALMGLFQSGDKDALALLFDRYGRSVYSIGLRILRNATEAQEVVQDVFL